MRRQGRDREERKEWVPKTLLGKDAVAGKYKDLGEVLAKGNVILEPEIVDFFIPNLKSDIVQIGGSPGKVGGQKRTPTRRTARMHKSCRRFKMSAMAVVGDENEIVGLGIAQSKENRTAIDKAMGNAKLAVIRVRKGCGSWECKCGGTHSIPFKVSASEGSVTVDLKPAPKGVGIVASPPVRRMLKLAGI